jgi:hypothetical protein
MTEDFKNYLLSIWDQMGYAVILAPFGLAALIWKIKRM